MEAVRLCGELDRLLPKLDAPDLEQFRRVAFAEAALRKIEALEAAAAGDGTVLAKVATYEEAMLKVIATLRPPPEEAPSEDEAAAEEDASSDASDGDAPEAPEEEPEAAPAPSGPDEAAALQQELARMTAALKASSLAVNEKLREQKKTIDKLDGVTTDNQDAVASGRQALDKTAAARTRTMFQSIVALAVVVLSFFLTFLFISLFPKHR
mmetsp:Transcript_12579/g.37415  ORF Transcript_12579/g.37415 Transcript_12579/m.37415 type:complete len:210 (-) Transcript_12579:43-672(-)